MNGSRKQQSLYPNPASLHEPWHISVRTWKFPAIVLGITITYTLLVWFSLLFTPDNIDTSPIWPPAGFSTAVLFLFGMRFLPAIALGSVAGSVFFSHLSPLATMFVMVADTAEAFVAVSLLRYLRFRPAMAHMRDVIVLVAATVFGSSVVGATIGTATFFSEGQMAVQALPHSWFVYWIANATANLTVAPLLFTWAMPRGLLAKESSARRFSWAESVILAALLATAISLILIRGTATAQLKLEYLLFPILVWIATRFGQRASATAVITVAIAAIVATAMASGPFLHSSISLSLLLMQIFILVYALTGSITASMAEERAAAKLNVTRARDSLENTVKERTEALKETNATLEAILDNVMSPVVACDSQGNIVRFNKAAENLYGTDMTGPAMESWGETFHLYKPDGKTPLSPEEVPLQRSLQGEVLTDVEVVVKVDPRNQRTFLVSGQPITSGNSVSLGAVITAHDITERKRSERLQFMMQQAAVIANEAPDEEQAVKTLLEIVCHTLQFRAGHALHVTQSEGQLIAMSTDWAYSASDNLSAFQQVHKSLRITEGIGLSGRVLSTAQPVWLSDVNKFDHRFGNNPLPNVVAGMAFPVMSGLTMVAILEFFTDQPGEIDSAQVGAVEFVCAQLGRVYERGTATQDLMKMTLRDPLTGMPNRLAFANTLKQAIAHAKRRSGYTFAVLFLDLDRFKYVNDTFGHAAGDEVIRESARRISQCLRAGDELARLGGDEFTILLDDLGLRSESANAFKVAQRISKELARPFTIGENEADISSSIGIVIAGSNYVDPDAILRDADTAMYRAKAAGRARIEIFSSEMHNVAVNTIRMECEMHKALGKHEFILHYQPIIRFSDRAVVGYEALVRWNHPHKGMLSPDEFIPLAEESEFITVLGKWVLDHACTWCAELNGGLPQGSDPVYVSVNISGVQFSSGHVIEQVSGALNLSGLSGKHLKLEIVESTLMKNQDDAVTALTALRKMGVQVSIDDFGTGYSSLAYLAKLPIDAVKIDCAFIASMHESKASAEVIRCIIGISTALNLDVVAEGIETKV